jgi:hypothetical protein
VKDNCYHTVDKLGIVDADDARRDGLTDRSPEAMSRAYVYAVMAFLASVFKVCHT